MLLEASRIFTVESIPARQAPSRTYAATDIIDFTAGDPEQIVAVTDGQGVDAAIEAFGFPKTWEACIRVTKAGERTSSIGYHGEVLEPL